MTDRESLFASPAQKRVDELYEGLRAHPMYERCVRLLRNGLYDWNASGAIQQAAQTLGMDRNAYCMSRLTANHFQWYDAKTGDPFTDAHLARAWADVVANV
jgi:hypothetical protein